MNPNEMPDDPFATMLANVGKVDEAMGVHAGATPHLGSQRDEGQIPFAASPSSPSNQAPTISPVRGEEGHPTSFTGLSGQDEFEWKGYRYRIGGITGAIKKQFEQDRYRIEALGIQEQARYLDPMVYIDLWREYLRGLQKKKWAWRSGESIWFRTATLEGYLEVVRLILVHYNNPSLFPPIEPGKVPPVYEDMLLDILEDELKFEELKIKIDGVLDPNPSAPHKAGGM